MNPAPTRGTGSALRTSRASGASPATSASRPDPGPGTSGRARDSNSINSSKNKSNDDNNSNVSLNIKNNDSNDNSNDNSYHDSSNDNDNLPADRSLLSMCCILRYVVRVHL